MNIRRTAVALTSAAALSITGVAMAVPASAADTKGDSLVNIEVGDVTVVEDVNVAVVADVLLQFCDVVDANVAVIAANVDQTSRSQTVCRQEDGDKVKITQN